MRFRFTTIHKGKKSEEITSILLQYQYLPSPYKMNGDKFCVDTKSPEYKNPLQYYDVYSKTACRMECKQNHVITICGCRSPNDKGFTIYKIHRINPSCRIVKKIMIILTTCFKIYKIVSKCLSLLDA